MFSEKNTNNDNVAGYNTDNANNTDNTDNTDNYLFKVLVRRVVRATRTGASCTGDNGEIG
ncbi:hypothetical protein RCZ04_09690 [Capnocytophaga sp. HP1101]